VHYLLQDLCETVHKQVTRYKKNARRHYKDCHVTKYRNEMQGCTLRAADLLERSPVRGNRPCVEHVPQGRGMRGAPLCPEGMPQGLPLHGVLPKY